MAEWVPLVVMPNLDMRGSIECDVAAIVSPVEPRIEALRHAHPTLETFLSKFKSQFGQNLWPSLLIVRKDAPKECFTAEAVTAFRDILSVSVVTYARSIRLRFDRAESLAFSSMFQFYPWMLDAKYEDVLLTNPAIKHVHLLKEFNGQGFPEQSQGTVFEKDIDLVLANALLNRWVARYIDGGTEWTDKALFRSLNMANEATRIPALTAATFYDVGRSLALWVSAFEILAHPGGVGQSNYGTVASQLEAVDWIKPALAAATHDVSGTPKQLATWVCRKLYNLRNDFLHGNDVDGAALNLNGRATIDFAACIFRLELTNFLGLAFDEPAPATDDLEAYAAYRVKRLRYYKYQASYEDALLKAI